MIGDDYEYLQPLIFRLCHHFSRGISSKLSTDILRSQKSMERPAPHTNRKYFFRQVEKGALMYF